MGFSIWESIYAGDGTGDSDLLKPDYIEGFSLLGGEPFEPENQAVLEGLLKRIKELYPEKMYGVIPDINMTRI